MKLGSHGFAGPCSSIEEEVLQKGNKKTEECRESQLMGMNVYFEVAQKRSPKAKRNCVVRFATNRVQQAFGIVLRSICRGHKFANQTVTVNVMMSNVGRELTSDD